MEPAVALAVVAAALLHASWHALVKSSGDRTVALAGMNVVSGVAAAMLLPFVSFPTAQAMLVIAGSVLLHGAYKLALAALYTRSDLTQAYPIARGLTPVAAAVLAAVLLHEVPSGQALAGIGAISLGIALLGTDRRAAAISLPTLGLAVLAGFSVAAYSAVDAYGVRINGDWLGFTAWLVACDSAAFVAYAVVSRGGKAIDMWRSQWGRTLISGLLGIGSFAVFMWALGRAQVGPVAALRETSVLFAALLGVLVLKERMTPARYLCAALVTGGAMAIAVAQ